MASDRRALFEAAYGALMIRSALPQPARRPAAGDTEQHPNSLPLHQLAADTEPTRRAG
jgi:hypothetical protein